MHRNTYIVVILLAVFAALVVGVNLGKRQIAQPSPTTQKLVPTTARNIPTPPAGVSPTPTLVTFTSTSCGIAFSYSQTLTKLDTEGGIMIIDTKTPAQSVAVVCQKDIPRPALTDDRIETVKLGSVSAHLYHDTSAKDGTPVDKLIFTHPTKRIDIYVSGLGEVFNQISSSLIIK